MLHVNLLYIIQALPNHPTKIELLDFTFLAITFTLLNITMKLYLHGSPGW